MEDITDVYILVEGPFGTLEQAVLDVSPGRLKIMSQVSKKEFSIEFARSFSGKFRSNQGKILPLGSKDIAMGSGTRNSYYSYGSLVHGCVRRSAKHKLVQGIHIILIVHWFMDVSATDANMNNASVQEGCNFATDSSLLVQLRFWKTHLFSGFECSIQTLTEARGEAGGRSAARAYNVKLGP